MNILSKLVVVIVALSSVSVAQASPIVIGFEFIDDGDLTPLFRGHHSPGVVTGLLFGFSDNMDDQRPTSMIITSDLSALGMTDTYFDNFVDFFGDGFDIWNEVVTDVELFFNFVDSTAGRMQIRINYRDYENFIMWNGGTGPITEIGNGNGYAGLAFTISAPVPEPGTLALLGLGLFGMAARRRKTS